MFDGVSHDFVFVWRETDLAKINNLWRARLHQRIKKLVDAIICKKSIKYAKTTLFEHISVLVNVQQSPTVMEELWYSYCSRMSISIRLSYTVNFRLIGTRVMDLDVLIVDQWSCVTKGVNCYRLHTFARSRYICNTPVCKKLELVTVKVFSNQSNSGLLTCQDNSDQNTSWITKL